MLGHSLDLGMCKATKRDGKACGGWCDKRVSDVCEYHMTTAVKRNRASRPEFSIGYVFYAPSAIFLFPKHSYYSNRTSGLSTGAKRTKPAFDPARQWGLLPDNSGGGGGATYVVSGHVVSGGASDPRSVYVGEAVGREAQAKAARASAKDADRALQRLLQRDKDGMKYVVSARDYEKNRAKKESEDGNGKGNGKGKGKPVAQKTSEKASVKGKRKQVDDEESEPSESSSDSSEDEDTDTPKKQGKSYSAQLIRNLGFDPTGREGKKVKDHGLQKKVNDFPMLCDRTAY